MYVLRCPAFIGRDDVLSDIAAHLHERDPAEPSTLTLVGAAGLGKSRLVAEVSTRAGAVGWLTVTGRAVEGPGQSPLRPFAELLRGIARHPGAGFSDTGADSRRVLAGLVREWAEPTSPTPGLTVLDLAEAMLQVLTDLCRRRPSLLVVEDLHAADPDTLAVLEYLADNLVLPRLALMVTARSGENDEVDELLMRLHARGATRVVALAPLPDNRIVEMAEACLGGIRMPDDLAELVLSSAEGSPLLVEDLLATMAGSGVLARSGAGWQVVGEVPDSVVPVTFLETVRRRMRLLPGHVRQLLQAAAVAGELEENLLAEIAELDTDQVSEGLWAAYDVHLLEPRAHGFAFRHQTTRHAVLALMPPRHCRTLAASTLDAIEKLHPNLEQQWAIRAAGAAKIAEQHQRAAALLAVAGARARDDALLRSAVRYFDDALGTPDLPPEFVHQVSTELIVTLGAAGEARRAATVGQELLADPTFPHRFDVHVALARAAVHSSDWALAAHHTNAASGAAPGPTPAQGATLALLEAAVALGRLEPERAEANALAALRDAELAGDVDLRCEALEHLGHAVRYRDVPASSAVFRQQSDLASRAHRPLWQARALSELGYEDVISLQPAHRLQEALEMATRVGAVSLTALTLYRLSVYHLWSYEIDRGVELIHRVQQLAARHRLGTLLPTAFTAEAAAYALLNDRQRVEELLDRARGHGPLTPVLEAMMHGAAQGVLALACDDRVGALDHFSRAHELVVATPGTNTAPYLGLWALLAAVRGDEDVAEAHLLAKGAHAHRINLGALHLLRAVHAGRARRADEAAQEEATGSRLLKRAPWMRQVLRRHVAEAALADGWGEPGAWLREAAGWFDAHAHRALAEASRAVLRRAGLPVPRQRRDGADVPPPLQGIGVTRREMEILLAVGDGLDNATIGARLFISPRTVEKHVENLQTKTGITTRAQLIAFATHLDPASAGEKAHGRP